MDFLHVLTVVLGSYLLGSIPFGLIVVKIGTGKDVRGIGSGRTGGTNAMRAAGLFAGLVTAILDVLKGVATGWLVNWLLPGQIWFQVAAAIMAILGHNYSIFLIRNDETGRLQWGGGAGGATCFGGSIALWSPIWIYILPLAILIYVIVGYASITTLSIAVLALLVFTYRAAVGLSPVAYVAYGVLASLVLLWALRPNLVRLAQGNERAVGLRAYILKKTRNNKMPAETGIR